jgi:hypothetical protein
MKTEAKLYDLLYNEDAYEYVRYIAFWYYPEYAEEPDVYPADLPSIDEVVNMPDDSIESELTCIGIRHDGFKIFREIVTGEKKFVFKRTDYENDLNIQRSLKLIGLNPEKFWHALLYIHYMAEMNNTDCVPVLPSVHDRVEDLFLALGEDGTKVSIKRPGKRAVVIDEPTAKKFMAEFLRFGDKHYVRLWNPTYTGRRVCHLENPKDVGLRWQIYDEYRAFMLLFDKYCTDKDLPKRVAGQVGSRDKDLLVSRILFMTRLVEDQHFRDSTGPLHSIKKKCQDNPHPMKSAGLF